MVKLFAGAITRRGSRARVQRFTAFYFLANRRGRRPISGISGDFTSNAITTKMRIGGGDRVNAVINRPPRDFKVIVFGTENGDVLTGQSQDARPYGGVANAAVSKEEA